MTKVIETVTNLFQNFFNQMGFIPTNTGDFNTDWMPLIFRLIMIMVACLLIYLAIAKGFEPYLLIPIGIGMLLVNIAPSLYNFGINDELHETGKNIFDYLEHDLLKPGLFDFLHLGIEWEIFPPLIFLGIGATTDFEAQSILPPSAPVNNLLDKKIAVGPSAPPIIPIDAASKALNPRSNAPKKVIKIPT